MNIDRKGGYPAELPYALLQEELNNARCKMGVPWGVLFLKIGGKRRHRDTLGDTPASMKLNTYNKTGDLGIF